MKIFKTKEANRTTYTYTFTNADGKEERVTLKPGENGVTEADIKMLHSFDDSEVYYNLKNLRPKRTEEEKAEIEKWKKEYINNVTKERGYAPTDDEVKEAEKEMFPSNYNLSLDYVFGNDDSDTDMDKSRILHQVATSTEEKIDSPETLRIRELISKLTEKQKNVVQKVWFEEMSFTEVAKETGTSPANIKQTYDRAIAYLRKNY